jgi:PhnB protein
MTFYQTCLGGTLCFQTVGASPLSEKLPRQLHDSILHATLKQSNLVLMATDMVCESGLIKGNVVSLILHCESEIEIRTCYAKLSEYGKANHPLEHSFWGALFGDLTDRFGVPWILHYDKNCNL